MNSQARAFVFTWHYPYDLVTELFLPGCTHLVYQEEVAPGTGALHLQGYVKFAKRIRGRQLMAMIEAYPDVQRAKGFHIEVAVGTPAENHKYCTKVESRVDPKGEPYVFGDFAAAGQGKRADLGELRDAIKSGKNFVEIADDDTLVTALAGHMRFAERAMVEYNVPVPREDIHVTLCLGPAGSGKTYCASTRPTDIADTDIYWKDDCQFWEGYTGQKMVIMDEFSGATMTPLQFQRFTDKYPVNCNKKGGSHAYAAKYVRLTSNFLPADWWKAGTTYSSEAVYRRIHEVHYHPRRGTSHQYFHGEPDEHGKPSEYAMEAFLRANHYMPRK